MKIPHKSTRVWAVDHNYQYSFHLRIIAFLTLPEAIVNNITMGKLLIKIVIPLKDTLILPRDSLKKNVNRDGILKRHRETLTRASWNEGVFEGQVTIETTFPYIFSSNTVLR